MAETTETGDAPVAALRHLTGASRGRRAWLTGAEHRLGLAPGGTVRLAAGPLPEGVRPLARLLRRDGGIEAVAEEGADLWVNGRPVRRALLAAGDTVEFGEDGPLSRFEPADGRSARRPLSDILDDARAYLASSRRPIGRRMSVALRATVDRVLHETTLTFRLAVLAALAGIVLLTLRQEVALERLGESVTEGARRIDAVSRALAEAEMRALKPGDLALLRAELGTRLRSTAERVAELENRREAASRVIARASPSVAFIEGAFGFREPGTGRMLRHILDSAGNRLRSPSGRPLLALEGDGPLAERAFTGTGVLVGGAAGLLTNRHVALPWEKDAASAAAGAAGLEPVLLHISAHFPGREDPLALSAARADAAADLALLTPAEGTLPDRPGLALAAGAPRVGDPVIVLGYPTGVRSMVAQAGREFAESLRQAGELDIGALAQRLSAAGLVRPLASSGIVGQIGPEAVVFDADTTHGGSGSPVLDLEGRLVALSSAIIPGYGGSNLGVPARRIRAFLAAPSP